MYHRSNECRDRIANHMKGNPENRKLSEPHGYTMEVNSMEVLTKEQARKKQDQIKKVILEIEKRERKSQKSIKEDQLNGTMGDILLEQMDVAEV